MGYFRNLAVLNGSTNVFLATQDKDVFKNCVKHFKYGSLADLIYYQNKDDKHIIMYEAPEMPKTSCLFKKPKISMNLASVSINKGTIKTNDNNSIYLNNERVYEEKLNNDEDNFDEPKKNQIRILLKRVGKKPLVKVINNNLEEKQTIAILETIKEPFTMLDTRYVMQDLNISESLVLNFLEEKIFHQSI